jgi:pentatricopeptide repeat protein
MRKNLYSIFLLLLIVGFLACGCSELTNQQDQKLQLKPGYDPNALVLLVLLDHRQNETLISWPRVAVAIGDGTLLLTAGHCVDIPPRWPKRQMSPEVVAVSPYYGDIYHCEIIAVDEKKDLAVLKAPWPVHPALAVADEEELRKTKEITVFSRPVRKSKKPHQLGRQIRTTTLAIEQLNATRPVVGTELKGAGPIRPGWSGSAMLLPKSAKVTGVISSLTGIKLGVPVLFSITFIFDTVGTNVESVWELLRQNNLQFVAKSYYPAAFEPVVDAQPAFFGIMDYFESLLQKESIEPLETAKHMVRLRPESSYAYFLQAISADKQAHEPDAEPQQRKASSVNSPRDCEEFLALADSSYQKALQLDPNSVSIRAAYGNFLLQRRRNLQALAETESVLALDPNNELAIINRLILLAQTEPNEAEKYAVRLIDKDPNNPDYWFYYGNALSKLGKNEQALEATQKAISLNPKGGYYGSLADILVKLDRLNEAERNYRKMTKSCGCQRCWYKYARFLVEHRPKKLDQAEKALAKVKAKAYMMRISEEDLALLRLNLTSAKFSPLQQKSPKKAEALAHRLIKKSPQDGYNYWALAGALRAQERYDEAVTAAEQAVQLNPDGLFYPRLADCLAKAGNLEKAEQTYDQMLDLHPDRPLYWFWYAKFLIDYFPERIEEAREALKKAQAPSDKHSPVPDKDLNKLREKIENKAATPQ